MTARGLTSRALRDYVFREFQQDTREHVLTVRHDAGDMRHLSFGKPGTSVYGVQVTTWPGHLCVSGDMGTFVWARLRDMFEFFRQPPLLDPTAVVDYASRINPGYWAEKLQAPRGTAGATEYSAELFRHNIQSTLTQFLDDHGFAPETRESITRSVRDEVLGCADDGEHAAFSAAMDFRQTIGYTTHRPFGDFWEVSAREFTHQYLWCCHVILRVIERYDAKQFLRGAL